jgi:hypothetical protein
MPSAQACTEASTAVQISTILIHHSTKRKEEKVSCTCLFDGERDKKRKSNKVAS